MASTRSRVKNAVTSYVEASELNTRERLIFSQAVYEFGSDAWTEISKLLSKHPLISRPKGTFTPQSCRVIYQQLMQEADLDSSEVTGPKSPVHLKLAQRHYFARVKELRELIAAEEAKFKALATEIDEIRNGLWDKNFHETENSHNKKVTLEQELPSREKTPLLDAVDQQLSVAEEPESAIQHPESEAQLAVQQESLVDTLGEGDPPSSEQNETTSFIPAILPDETVLSEVIHTPLDAAMDTTADQPEEDQDLDTSMRVDDDEEVPDPEEEAPVEDTSAIPGSDDPAIIESPDQDEMAVVEEPAPIETDVDPAPSTPTDGDRRADGKRKASELETPLADAPREKKRQRDESEPTEDDESSGRGRRRLTGSESQVVSKRFQNVITLLHSTISAHRYGNLFHNPIKKSEAPDYHDIVKRPIDLKTIKARIKDGVISNSLEFQRDVYLMFANAMMYNRPGSDIYAMTEEMMLASEAHIDTFRHTEGFHRA